MSHTFDSGTDYEDITVMTAVLCSMLSRDSEVQGDMLSIIVQRVNEFLPKKLTQETICTLGSYGGYLLVRTPTAGVDVKLLRDRIIPLAESLKKKLYRKSPWVNKLLEIVHATQYTLWFGYPCSEKTLREHTKLVTDAAFGTGGVTVGYFPSIPNDLKKFNKTYVQKCDMFLETYISLGYFTTEIAQIASDIIQIIDDRQRDHQKLHLRMLCVYYYLKTLRSQNEPSCANVH